MDLGDILQILFVLVFFVGPIIGNFFTGNKGKGTEVRPTPQPRQPATPVASEQEAEARPQQLGGDLQARLEEARKRVEARKQEEARQARQASAAPAPPSASPAPTRLPSQPQPVILGRAGRQAPAPARPVPPSPTRTPATSPIPPMPRGQVSGEASGGLLGDTSGDVSRDISGGTKREVPRQRATRSAEAMLRSEQGVSRDVVPSEVVPGVESLQPTVKRQLKHQQIPIGLERSTIINGIIWKQILDKPRAKQAVQEKQAFPHR